MQAVDGRQLKAGRVILGLTIREMAEAAKLNRNSVLNVEAQTQLPRHAHAADRIAEALEQHGIMFEASDGAVWICFKAPTTRGRKRYTRQVA